MSRILYFQYTNPAGYPPLEHSSRLLADAGWQVMFAGTGALGAAALKFPPHDRITVRQMPHCLAGWRQKLHYVRFMLWAFVLTLRWSPRWVYASDHLSCPLALVLSYLPGRHVIYHEHDSPIMESGSGLFKCITLAARRRLARRAKLCILPNQRRVERFAVETDGVRATLCVWNCPRRAELTAPRNGARSDDLWVLYHGSVVPARLPVSVFQALRLLPENVKLRVIGYETIGHVGYVAQLQETAARLGLSQRVEFIPAMPRAALLQWGRRCDVGLAFFSRQSRDFNEQTMTGASNKPFDYLSCGLALLVSDLPDWRRMYVQPGYGLACDSDQPESIAEALRWFLAHREEVRQMGERGRQRIAAEWNYETQFRPVLERLNQTA